MSPVLYVAFEEKNKINVFLVPLTSPRSALAACLAFSWIRYRLSEARQASAEEEQIARVVSILG